MRHLQQHSPNTATFLSNTLEERDEIFDLVANTFPYLGDDALLGLYLNAVSVKKWARKQDKNPKEEVLYFLGLLVEHRFEEAKALLGQATF